MVLGGEDIGIVVRKMRSGLTSGRGRDMPVITCQDRIVLAGFGRTRMALPDTPERTS